MAKLIKVQTRLGYPGEEGGGDHPHCCYAHKCSKVCVQMFQNKKREGRQKVD